MFVLAALLQQPGDEALARSVVDRLALEHRMMDAGKRPGFLAISLLCAFSAL